MDSPDQFNVIELYMLDKYKFFPLSGFGSFFAQVLLHPLGLIRTRLVMQQNRELYNGFIHGGKSIIEKEGFSGLYSGFYVKSLQLFTGIAYVMTYESVRDHCKPLGVDDRTRSFIAGGCASAVGQSLVVPIDVVSQHLMILNNKDKSVGRLSGLRLSDGELKTPLSRFVAVCRHIFQESGIKGFYRGCAISLATFVPNSALWWSFYTHYCSILNRMRVSLGIDPSSTGMNPGLGMHRTITQVIAAPMAGVSAAVIMNPMDCIRMRMQVQHGRFKDVVSGLWREEGLRWFTKGLTARLTQSVTYSFWIILIYEQLKLMCLKPEYRNQFYR